MVAGLLALAGAPGELPEAEVAVGGDEGTHAARLGEGHRLAVVGLAALGIEPVVFTACSRKAAAWRNADRALAFRPACQRWVTAFSHASPRTA